MLKGKELLLGLDKLINYFGYVPSFHDFEVQKIVFERDGPSMMLNIYGFEVEKTTESENYLIKKECLICILVKYLKANVLKNFNRQNVIQELKLIKADDMVRCIISSSYGLSGEILAQAFEVTDVIELSS